MELERTFVWRRTGVSAIICALVVIPNAIGVTDSTPFDNLERRAIGPINPGRPA